MGSSDGVNALLIRRSQAGTYQLSLCGLRDGAEDLDVPPSGIEVVAASRTSMGIDWGGSLSKLTGECDIKETGRSSSRFQVSSNSIGDSRGRDDNNGPLQCVCWYVYVYLFCLPTTVTEVEVVLQGAPRRGERKRRGPDLGGCRALSTIVQLVDERTGEFTYGMIWRWENAIADT